ncbi:MAG: hypothetical protein ACKPEQ_31920, partial [Dolichospermum sp.]
NNNLPTLKAKSGQRLNVSNYPQRHNFKVKINPIWILGIITVIAGLTAIDSFRFNSSIQKPEHRYFADPNYYFDIPK